MFYQVLQLFFRDYVHGWYYTISTDEGFLYDLRQTLQRALIAFANRLVIQVIILSLTSTIVNKYIGTVQHFIFQLTFYYNNYILGSIATPPPPLNVSSGKWSENSVQGWKSTSLCPTLIRGEEGGIWSPKNVHWTEINASVPKKFVHDCRFTQKCLH